ncbi:MAG TPA: serine/threonine-protein kinase, partial [Pirellulales bacterium]
MSKAEIDAYLSALQKSGLVPKEQVSSVLSRIIREAGGKRIDAQYVATCFEQAGLVTAWHNEKLIKGRYKGFFLGSYKLLGHIGTGGMSNIYLGEHVQMRRRVAVKVLPPTLTTNTSHLQRFIMESRVIASLDHPNIVRAYDIAHQGSFHYLVLEFVEGCDLRRTVEERGPLPYEEAADYVRQAADGLHHAHSKGVVHRDVKPANLLVDTEGIVKVLDMGLTRIIDSNDPSLTLAHNEKLIGTVDYIAPEQANNSHNVDARADVYSLGCSFYFLLTGHPPFPDGSQTQRLMAHQQTPVKPIAEERPDCPPELWDVIQRMMAKKVKDRIQSD